MTDPLRQARLAVHFPGVNATTVWGDPEAGSMIDFASFEHVARTADDAGFDFLFLAEGLRMREHAGRLHELDVAGRPDGVAILAAIAAVTERLGLVTTITTTYHEPFELARQLGSVDALSGGRAGWNLVTSSDPFTGENFRRGGYLAYGDRYARGEQFVAAANAMWDSWSPDGVVADAAAGVFARGSGQGAFEHHGDQVDVTGTFSVPRSPQGRPVMLQAGDSDAGREFAARFADGIFTRHGDLDTGRVFSQDVKRRLAAYGRAPDDLLILPGTTFVLADTDAEAQELAVEVRRRQTTGQHAIMVLEQLWNRDLSHLDPDGPLPDEDPDTEAQERAQGTAAARELRRTALETAQAWRDEAAADGLSIRELVTRRTARASFVGSPTTVADAMHDHVQGGACDGFILVPHITPGGLDRFAAEVVPRLADRGSFDPGRAGSTLRERMGLGAPPAR